MALEITSNLRAAGIMADVTTRTAALVEKLRHDLPDVSRCCPRRRRRCRLDRRRFGTQCWSFRRRFAKYGHP